MDSTAVVNLAVILAGLVACVSIVLYATWLLTVRLRSGTRKSISFKEWLSNVAQAILGL